VTTKQEYPKGKAYDQLERAEHIPQDPDELKQATLTDDEKSPEFLFERALFNLKKGFGRDTNTSSAYFLASIAYSLLSINQSFESATMSLENIYIELERMSLNDRQT